MKLLKLLFLTLIVVLTLSCNRSVKNLDSKLIFDHKVDSVLLQVSRANDLYIKIGDNDTLHPQKLFPLVKTVKSEGTNLNFQFRQGIDCHSQFEIILCYKDALIYGIPFTDNYYYNKFHGDTSKYQQKLSFEKELNRTIDAFLKSNQKNNQDELSFSVFFVESIMNNMTKYKCRKVITYLDDLEQILKNTKENISRGLVLDDIGKQNALNNIKELEHEIKDQKIPILLYYFYNNHCIYRFDFQRQPQNGKYVYVRVINKECFFDPIF